MQNRRSKPQAQHPAQIVNGKKKTRQNTAGAIAALGCEELNKEVPNWRDAVGGAPSSDFTTSIERSCSEFELARETSKFVEEHRPSREDMTEFVRKWRDQMSADAWGRFERAMKEMLTNDELRRQFTDAVDGVLQEEKERRKRIEALESENERLARLHANRNCDQDQLEAMDTSP